MQLAEGLYAYPWTQYHANNANTYLVGGSPYLMIDRAMPSSTAMWSWG